MSKKEIIELTKVEINYLYNLVIDNIREGSYWGNRGQFLKIQNTVLNELEEVLEETSETTRPT